MEYGLIGEKLGHSYSPLIHRCFGDYEYRLCPMDAEEMDRVLRKRDFRGLNVTIPYKRAVLPYCDGLSEEVKQIGSANTLVMRSGRLIAHNTDLAGFLYMLRRGGIRLTGKKVLILGSGGTSLTARAVCGMEGAGKTVTVSRTGPVTYADAYAAHADAEVILNATPVGMYPNTGEKPVEIGRFPRLESVADVIYNPARTALLQDAEARGIRHAGGLWMLAAQGYYAAQLFLDAPLPEDRIAQAYRAVRRQCLNLVLTGMPGSGKSTLGRLAAERLGRRLVDVDAEITARFGPIPEIFARQGEEAFREMESGVIRECAKESGLVIAAGGGAVLREENVRALRQNAAVAWVRRPLERLATEGRPLSAGAAALRQMAQIRTPLYQKAADFAVMNDGGIEAALNGLLEGFYESAGH